VAWSDGLEGSHLNIARYPGSPMRVVAGPGTGKTFSLMRRISRLLEEEVDPKSILAISFTRTAAMDLINHLARLGAPRARDVNARTLHSLAFSLLNQEAVFQATNRVPRPLMQYETDFLIADMASQFGGKNKTKAMVAAFEAAWATLQHQQPGWPKDPEQQAFHRDLMRWLNYHEAILIGEVVPLAHQYLKQNPASAHAPRYTHVLVDEYQDLNRSDQELIDELARNGQLVVVGDEDQSIYVQLRYAHPEGISKFEQTHPGTHDEMLNECRRCPQVVIGMANSLIKHNERMKQQVLTPLPSNPAGQVYIVQHESLDAEITNIASFVNWYMNANPSVRPSEILVLCTRRLIGYRIRDELRRLQRPAQSFFTEECLEKTASQEGFCLLTLLVRPNDRSAFRAWLGLANAKTRNVQAYRRLREVAEVSQLSPRRYLEEGLTGQRPMPGHTSHLLPRCQELLARLAALTGKNGVALIDLLWPPDIPECADIRGMALLVVGGAGAPDAVLEGLLTAIIQPELPAEEEEVIRVMSLYKSKGLTARCVIVTGCVAGAMPTLKDNLSSEQRQKALEEQRRLFYVAMTRTTETLVVSSAATSAFSDAWQMRFISGRKIGNMAVLQATPFLSELGSHSIRVQSGTAWRQSLGF